MMSGTNKLGKPQFIHYGYLKPRISKTIKVFKKVTL